MKSFAPLRVAFLVTVAISNAASSGGYTTAQASRGRAVYVQHCQQCHGANLQGQSGTPLTGQTFRQAYGNGTVAPLYDFISRQMPANAPGSLSQQNYLDVTAYVLSKNGYPAGATPLTTGDLAQYDLAAQRVRPAGGNSSEIVRAAPPTRHVYGKLPAGADVTISDAMMTAANEDQKNWLLHGRTYDNQRYSPLAQINAENVKTLIPVALLQTGFTASFETTPIVATASCISRRRS